MAAGFSLLETQPLLASHRLTPNSSQINTESSTDPKVPSISLGSVLGLGFEATVAVLSVTETIREAAASVFEGRRSLKTIYSGHGTAKVILVVQAKKSRSPPQRHRLGMITAVIVLTQIRFLQKYCRKKLDL